MPTARVLQATLPVSDYAKRLAITWGLFFSMVGGPIAYQTFDPWTQVRRERAL